MGRQLQPLLITRTRGNVSVRARRLIFGYHIESRSLTASKKIKATLPSQPNNKVAKEGD